MQSREKNQRRLESGKILCTWTWSQGEWDSLARSIQAIKPPFSTHILQTIKFIMVIIGLVIVFRMIRRIPLSSLWEFESILGFIVLFILFVFLSWFLEWFNRTYFPKPQPGQTPVCIIARTGVRLGDRFFFWKSPLVEISTYSRQNSAFKTLSPFSLQPVKKS